MGPFGRRLGGRAISTVVAFGVLFSFLCYGVSYESNTHGAAWQVEGTGGRVVSPPRNQTARTRKLLAIDGGRGGRVTSGGGDGDSNDKNKKKKERWAVDRMGLESCTKEDVAVYQGATAPLPNGIPTYTVEVLNACASGCGVSGIHVACGWFSSARLINPRVFRRLRFDDCLVNDGGPLAPGQSLSFQYANSFPYPLVVTSVSCY